VNLVEDQLLIAYGLEWHITRCR